MSNSSWILMEPLGQVSSDIGENKKIRCHQAYEKLFSRIGCFVNDPPLMGGLASFCALHRATDNWKRWIPAEPPRLRAIQGSNNDWKIFYYFREAHFGENAFPQSSNVKNFAIMNLKQIKWKIFKKTLFSYNWILKESNLLFTLMQENN